MIADPTEAAHLRRWFDLCTAILPELSVYRSSNQSIAVVSLLREATFIPQFDHEVPMALPNVRQASSYPVLF